MGPCDATMPLGRPTGGSLENSGWRSLLPTGHWLLGCGLFREAELADHWLRSDVVDSDVPFDWEPLVATVVLDALEEALDETDEDELLRERVFRGTNMPRPSSGFIGLFPLIVPHAGRDS